MITNGDGGGERERPWARRRAWRPFPLAPETNRSGGGGRLAPAFLLFRRGERIHRTNRVPYQAFAGLLAGLLLGSPPQTAARAQAPPARPSSSALIVPLNATVQIQMSTQKRIAS